MGACFGCCPTRNSQRKQRRNKFMQTDALEYSQALRDDQELLELEQRADGRSSTPLPLRSGVPEIKTTKLAFKKTHFSWLRSDNQVIPSSLHNPAKSPADSVMPLLHRENSFADTCSFSGSQKWEKISFKTTPSSSVDLEWENEIGFNLSPNFGATEELHWMVLTENTNTSWRSSPISNSNGLEWDGDFTSVDISDIVTETQRLTADLDQHVEQITSNTYRDVDNNS